MPRRAWLAVVAVSGPALVAVAGLALAACGGSATTNAARGTTTAAAPVTTTIAAEATTTAALASATTAAVTTTAVAGTAASTAAATAAGIVPGSATGDSPCEKSGPPVSQGQSADGHGARGKQVPIPLTPADEALLTTQQEQAGGVIARYPTVAEAEAAGYVRSTVYIPCIGAHYTNLKYAARFDIDNPSELLYDGTAPTSKIVGLSYLVWHPGSEPEGFAGKNDHWHQHNQNGGLCLAGGEVVGGEDMDAATCTSRGGIKRVLTDIWMLHDWVAPTWQCSWGVFAGECPELGGKVGFDANA